MQTGFLTARLVAFALGAAPPETDGGINYDELLAFSKEQSVAALVCCALEKLGQLPEEYKAKFIREKRLAMAREATQEIETQEIADELRARGIRFMLLKGCVMKQLYPLPFLRSMCDVDIQYDTAKKSEITELMLARGYRLRAEEGTGGVNISFERQPFMNIEFHGVLMDADVPAYHAYFGTDFERTVPAQGSEVKYTDEDFFVFMAAHTAKHYFAGGTGLRSVADMWLWFRSKPEINKDYVFAQLREINLDVFVKKMLGVAQVLFEGAVPDEGQRNICEYIFNSRTYGTTEHLSTRGVENGKKGSFVLRRLFPDRAFMAVNYPAVGKCVLLLPLFWLARLTKALFGGKLKQSDVSAVLSTGQASLDARNIEGKPEVIILKG